MFEYAENGDLFELVAYEKFSENLSRFYFKQILSAVAAMHDSQLMHLDLKLENFVINGNYDVQIVDFGFAKMAIDGNWMTSGRRGTEGYMAPEVEEQKGYYDGRSADVFSLGVCLFTLVMGNFPF